MRQGSTPLVSQWYTRFEIVIWWATPVEIAGALARLLRIGHLDAHEWRNAAQSIAKLAETWHVVPPSAAIRAKAIEVVEHYDLRAADSLQLAAASAWCEDAPLGRAFLTLDNRLREAAMLTGFGT
ncbi:MAG: type II toxin-antitoxin system VapC family toxin [Candidatus Korobacteraceae bacterium]